MKVCNLLLAGALAIGTSAGSVPPNADPPIVDFNSYRLPGCHEEDRGAYMTLTQTQDSVCYDFPSSTVQSAFVTDVISGCVVYVYTDTACVANEVTLGEGVENCYDEPAGLGSYMVVCGRRYPIPPHSTSIPVRASHV